MVEDDQVALEAMSDALERMKYRVLRAVGGHEALGVYDQESVDLVLSDLVMPGMGGDNLFAALKKRDPDIKMIVMTGYPLDEVGRQLLEQGIVGWVQKPLDGIIISRMVRKALNL